MEIPARLVTHNYGAARVGRGSLCGVLVMSDGGMVLWVYSVWVKGGEDCQ